MRSLSRLALSPLVGAVLVAGCGGGQQADKPVPAGPNSAQAAPPPATDASLKPRKAMIKDGAGKTEFSYSWPQEAVRIPALDTWLRGNGEGLRRETMQGAANEQATAKKDGYEFNGYGYEEEWGVVADMPALLVLQSEGYSFTGGAHGMPIVTALIWDKAAKRRLATSALLDMPKLTATIRERFCKALDAERAKRRGEPVDADNSNPIDDFVRCVDLNKQLVLPVAEKGGPLDTIRIIIMPYEAGPYAEGIYEIDLPVDAGIIAAVKPAWRESFRAER